MGYYTRYDLCYALIDHTYVNKDEEIIRNLAEINPNYFDGRVDSIEWLFEEEMKWYSHEEDMIELSKRMPNTIFVLYGEGEDHDDSWKEFFCNGDYEICTGTIVFDKPKKDPFKTLKFI